MAMPSKSGPWAFSITDIARFLGKAPVTIRKWDRTGEIQTGRIGPKRSVGIEGMKLITEFAYENARITPARAKLVEETLFMMGIIQQENEKKGKK